MAWYEEWTGKPAKKNDDNVKHIYDELTGKIDHDRLGLRAAPLDYIPRREATAVTQGLPALLRDPGAE